MSTFNQVEASARIAFDGEHFEDALIHSSCLIEKLRKQTVAALELRAAIWEKKAKLTQELDDVVLIIKYDGDNTNAYLRVAKLYSIQGKQQDAIDALERARNSSPSDEQVELIQQQINIAKARLERRIDFITDAPFEIARNIVSYFDYYYHIKKCMDVSDGWRTIILECPEPWESSINTRYARDWFWDTPAVFHELIPIVSRHVKDLVVYSLLTTNFNEFFHTCNFSRLQNLKIIRMFDQDAESLGTPLYHALSQLPVLKELDIEATITVYIGKLLSSCPSLTSLILHVKGITDWDTGLPITTLLKTLKLWPWKTRLTADNVESLLQCTPHLRHLRLKPPLDDILYVLKDNCPKLATLFNHSGWERYKISYEVREVEEIPGLQQVLYHNIQSTVPLHQRLEESSNSMRKIHLVPLGGGRGSVLSDWRPLSASVMPNMTYLGIRADLNSAIFKHLPTMLCAYPALQALYLSGDESMASAETTDQIFDAVAQLNNLTNLNLVNIPAKGQSLRRLIDHYTKQEQPILKELSLAYLNMDHKLLHAVAQIRSLRHLLVRMEKVEKIPESDAVEFSRLIAQLPELTDLDLYDMELTKRATEYIGSNKNLERLELINFGQELEDDAYNDVCHLFAHIPI